MASTLQYFKQELSKDSQMRRQRPRRCRCWAAVAGSLLLCPVSAAEATGVSSGSGWVDVEGGSRIQDMRDGERSSASSSLSCPSDRERASPVNIVPHSALPSGQSLRLKYNVWNVSNVSFETDSEEESTTTLQLRFNAAEGGGTIQVGVGFSDMDEYILRRIIVQTPSEHTFLGRKLPLEVQLWHEPVIKRDLHRLRAEREQTQLMMDRLHDRLVGWSDSLKKIYEEAGSAKNVSFPNLQTELDWVASVRDSMDQDGEELLLAADKLRKQVQKIDQQIGALNARLERPDLARMVVLSLLFRMPDALDMPQSVASELLQWILTAMALDQPDGSAGKSLRKAKGIEPLEVFDFQTLRQSDKKSVLNSFLGYHGSFTRPPCTPMVHWFVASEPVAIPMQDFAALFSRLPSAASLINPDGKVSHTHGIWWKGPLEDTPVASKQLPNAQLAATSLGFSPFTRPVQVHLSGDVVSQLPWPYIQACNAVFLICSVMMLGTACSMWSHQCCDD
eukprot:TRINITY_DN9578_c2_g1_i1.p1 TRINITY_DN9578_c2_g1~~TRINITY_DN9578_c2_g1_i1.p1  ORF type:complete len:505 (-),score=92.65 TRINITY_DN9578_c2_g1_i1:57-1571(-)